MAWGLFMYVNSIWLVAERWIVWLDELDWLELYSVEGGPLT